MAAFKINKNAENYLKIDTTKTINTVKERINKLKDLPTNYKPQKATVAENVGKKLDIVSEQ